MKINSLQSFGAYFDNSRNSNLNFIKNAYNQAIESDNIEKFDNLMKSINKMRDGKIDIILSSPKRDVFMLSYANGGDSYELTILKNGKDNGALDVLDNLESLLKHTFI